MYHGSTAAQPTVYSKGGGTGLLSCPVREAIVEKTSTRMLYLPKCSRYVVPPTTMLRHCTVKQDGKLNSNWYFRWEKPKI